MTSAKIRAGKAKARLGAVWCGEAGFEPPHLSTSEALLCIRPRRDLLPPSL